MRNSGLRGEGRVCTNHGSEFLESEVNYDLADVENAGRDCARLLRCQLEYPNSKAEITLDCLRDRLQVGSLSG